MDNPWYAGRLTVGRRPRLLFGRMYEDHGVELALFPPASRVLAIASAGDTAAALAQAGHRVTAVDVNPTQLRYAHARLAGAPARTGTAERVMAIGRAAVRTVLASWRPAALEEFLRLTNTSVQAAWWRQELDRPPLRALMSVALGPAGPLAMVLRRGMRAAIPYDLTLRRRIADGVARYPNATNPWAWRLLLGRDGPDAVPPTTMPATNVPPSNVAGVRWLNTDVVAHLAAVPAAQYDAVTLSNVLDGAPPELAAQLLDALRHAVRPGGHVVLRTFRDRSPLPGQPLPDRSLLWGAVTRVQIGD